MQRLAFTLFTAAATLGAFLPPAPAADPKPIAALATASYNDFISDVDFVGGLADRPQSGVALDALATLLTQGKGLAGIDKTRPCGAILQASGEADIAGYALVPTTNFKNMLDLLKLYAQVDASGDVYKVTLKNLPDPLYIKQQGDWACVSDKAESLAHIVADPLAIFKGMEKGYVVAGRIFLTNVPDTLREKFFVGLKEGMENESRNKKDNETDEQFAQRKKLVEQIENYVVRVASDLDQINLGWGLDRSEEKTYVDFSLTAKPGTETANEMALAALAKTSFDGFRMADAASLLSVAGVIPQSKQQIAATLIELVRSYAIASIEKDTPQDKRDVAKEILGDSLDLVAKIVKSGRVDAVLTSLVGSDSATGLIAAYVADGPLFDKIVHAAVKEIGHDHPEMAQYFKLDANTFNGLHVHRISIPVPGTPENRDVVAKYIGDKLDIVVAVGKEDVYLAAGRDAETKLKKAVKASDATSSKAVSPFVITYAFKPIASLMASEAKPDQRPAIQKVVAELNKSPGKDHVNFIVRPIANGVQMRLEVEEGVLRAAGRLTVMQIEGAPAPGQSSEK